MSMHSQAINGSPVLGDRESVPFPSRPPRYDRPLDHAPWRRDQNASEPINPMVEMDPSDIVSRRARAWQGLAAEAISIREHRRTESRFRAPVHLLVLFEEGARRDGSTFIEGLPRSQLRNYRRKLLFVPAGHEYHDWQEPRTLARLAYFYFDPASLQVQLDLDIAELSFAPRLFFEDAGLWDQAIKLKALIDHPQSNDRLYSEALGVVLVHEVVRLHAGVARTRAPVRGGLAAWQQRTIANYIEEHLAEPICLATLAQLVRLSPYHFCRSFKQSFGTPPHRFHTHRRIERAKALLTQGNASVTDVGIAIGFSETSSFTAAFRKVTGLTPTGYQRSIT
jgi:AraC family transcriptional regulator